MFDLLLKSLISLSSVLEKMHVTVETVTKIASEKHEAKVAVKAEAKAAKAAEKAEKEAAKAILAANAEALAEVAENAKVEAKRTKDAAKKAAKAARQQQPLKAAAESTTTTTTATATTNRYKAVIALFVTMAILGAVCLYGSEEIAAPASDAGYVATATGENNAEGDPIVVVTSGTEVVGAFASNQDVLLEDGTVITLVGDMTVKRVEIWKSSLLEAAQLS